MLFYRAALPLSRKTVTFVAGVIRRHRVSIGSLWQKLNPGQQESGPGRGRSRCLGPGGQPDGQPTDGEVVDDAAATVGFGDTVSDEPLVHREVGEWPVLGQPVGGSCRGP